MRLRITIIILLTIPVLAYCSGIHDHVYYSFQIVDAIKDSFKNEFGIDVVNNLGLSTKANRYF